MVNDLSLAVPGRTLCRGLSFAVRAGEIWAVVGPNGAGKTTLLATLAGLRAPAAGSFTSVCMRTMFVPRPANCATTEPFAPWPKLVMAMNAEMPIARPSTVSPLRAGLRVSALTAMRKISAMSRGRIPFLPGSM